MPPPGDVRTSSTKWQVRQFIDMPLNGPGLIGAPKVSRELTTPSPTLGLLTLPPLSMKALNACANRVSRNRRSPTSSSAPGVPGARAIGGDELSAPEQATRPMRKRREKRRVRYVGV